MLGYVYQARYALLLLSRRNRAAPNVRVSVEKFNDVAFESSGLPDEAIQTKHCAPGNLTDLGEELWGTPRVWSEGVRDNQFLQPGTVFTPITTQTAPLIADEERRLAEKTVFGECHSKWASSPPIPRC